MKAYYIDSENINNFFKFSGIMSDLEDGDIIYVFYTKKHQKDCVERTLLLRESVRVLYLQCKTEKEPLDEKIKMVVCEHYGRYKRHIIISSDKDFTGFIIWGKGDLLGPLKKCERRGVQGDLWYRI